MYKCSNVYNITVKEAGGTSEVEILIGVLTAVTLLLLFLFVVVLAYSRRQKLLNSPTSRSPFPVQINMKVKQQIPTNFVLYQFFIDWMNEWMNELCLFLKFTMYIF